MTKYRLGQTILAGTKEGRILAIDGDEAYIESELDGGPIYVWPARD
jgi:hypothetical protein